MLLQGADLYVTQPCLVYFLNVTLVMWIVHIALLILLINCWVRLRRGRLLCECSQPASTAKRKRGHAVKPQPQPQPLLQSNSTPSGASAATHPHPQPHATAHPHPHAHTHTHMLVSSNSHNVSTPVGSSRIILTPDTRDGRTPLGASNHSLVTPGKQQFDSGAPDWQWTSERALQLQSQREREAVSADAAVSPGSVLMVPHLATPLAPSSRAVNTNLHGRGSQDTDVHFVQPKPPPTQSSQQQQHFESKQDVSHVTVVASASSPHGPRTRTSAVASAGTNAMAKSAARPSHRAMEDSTEFPSLPDDPVVFHVN